MNDRSVHSKALARTGLSGADANRLAQNLGVGAELRWRGVGVGHSWHESLAPAWCVTNKPRPSTGQLLQSRTR